MKNFKTPKGTELPVMSLKGKDYLEVKWRIVWFREERPDWRIKTIPITLEKDSALFNASILNEKNEVVAMGHKLETKQGFADFVEKAETGAIGRALALCGFGTQFCGDDLDEGERIVDSPVQRTSPIATAPPVGQKLRTPEPQPTPKTGPGIISFGKFKGKRLQDVPRVDLMNYIASLVSFAESKGEKPSSNVENLMNAYNKMYLD